MAQDLPVNQLILPETGQTIRFIWMRDDHHANAAMLIPVKLEGCPRQFYMQFDTGSPYSSFYRSKLKDIQQQYPQVTVFADKADKLIQLRFTADHTPIPAKAIVVLQTDSTGLDWSENAQEIIGTIGTDIFDNKVLRINYPEMYISIGNIITGEEDIRWSGFLYTRRSILLPAIIRGKATHLYFDTGSSAFELLIDRENALLLATPGGTISTFKVRSWDKALTATRMATADSIIIASEKLALRSVAFIEGVSEVQVNAMRNMGIGGMTGNSLFRDVQLIIDTRTGKFGIQPANTGDSKKH